jgi:hypothetical protein
MAGAGLVHDLLTRKSQIEPCIPNSCNWFLCLIAYCCPPTLMNRGSTKFGHLPVRSRLMDNPENPDLSTECYSNNITVN